MYLILLGAPGAGKGTQAQMLEENLGIPALSSGDLFRENIRLGTALGREARGYMNRGELVPDSIVINMIVKQLRMPVYQDGVLLDGFPRSLAQAEALDTALKTSFNSGLAGVIYIKVETEELLSRLGGRWLCPTCNSSYHEIKNPPEVAGICDLEGATLFQREDDNRLTAENRLKVYFNQTMPLIKYYTQRGLLVEIDGDQAVEEVQQEIVKALALTSLDQNVLQVA